MTCLLLASVGIFRRGSARIRKFGGLAIEDVIANRCRFCPTDAPRNVDAAAVKIQRSICRVIGWVTQQHACKVSCPGPARRVARLVAFAVAPPGELARRLFSTLKNDIAGRIREIRACHTIQYRPADCNHAGVNFAAGLPIQGQRETVLLFHRAVSARILCVLQCDKSKQEYRQYRMRF